MSKSVTITITINCCHGCPEKNCDGYGDSYCNHFDICDSFRGRKIHEENCDSMTETCPLYQRSLEGENKN